MPLPKIAPHVTEKTVSQAKGGQYTFLVDSRLTSQAVSEAIRRLYDVHPVRASLLKNAPKIKGVGRTRRVRPGRAKAVVTLKKGEKIADFIIEEKKS